MNFRKIATLAIAALLLAACGKSSGARGSGKITVSNIEKDGRNYTITLNGVITIRNVQIKSGSGGQFLAFPQRKGQGDRFFNYVKIERADADFLLQQVKNEEIAATPTGFEITAVKIKLLTGPGKKKAFVEFELNGVLKLHSWGIIIGDKGPFLVPPSERVGDDWKDVVFASREFREQLQTAALAEYEKEGGSLEATPDAAAPAGAPAATEEAGGE
jgi:DNA-binding cell septation regulator SpoVG